MTASIISIEHLSKRYRLGQLGATSLRDTIDRLSGTIKGKMLGGKQSPPVIPTSDNDLWALRDINFEIMPGEVLGIIGRNGAGKSTLLKILSRITEPTSGRAIMRGRVASLLEVGTGFHPELTGRENIFLNGAILGMRKNEIIRKFDEIVAFAEVDKFIDTPVKHYSSGMYVRLAFAVAAHLEPEILLVDEVLAVGDVDFQQKCMGKMSEVSKQGRTILFISHNMLAIEELCDRVVLIQDGQCAAMGGASQVVQDYLKTKQKHSQDNYYNGTTQYIRSVVVKNIQDIETDTFSIGDDIIFDIELFHPTRLDVARVSIGLHSPRGDRLVTIHTDIQQKSNWPFEGRKRIRAIWKNNPMVPLRYRLDVSLWGASKEMETLVGIKHIDIVPRDIYGTGALPHAVSQGFFIPDACWIMNPEIQ